VYELADVGLWRERRQYVLRGVESARLAGRGRSSVGEWVRGLVERGLGVLGYSDRGSSRSSAGVVPRGVRCRRERSVRRRRYGVDSRAALTRFEAAVTSQVSLAGGDPAVEAAARALREALGPASRQLALELVEQAAAEVDAQLAHHRVEVVLRGGEPALDVRSGEQERGRPADEGYEARITLRLPPSLKSAVEEAARAAGESVNSYLVGALSRSTARPAQVGRRMKGTVRT
jgi:HicB family